MFQAYETRPLTIAFQKVSEESNVGDIIVRANMLKRIIANAASPEGSVTPYGMALRNSGGIQIVFPHNGAAKGFGMAEDMPEDAEGRIAHWKTAASEAQRALDLLISYGKYLSFFRAILPDGLDDAGYPAAVEAIGNAQALRLDLGFPGKDTEYYENFIGMLFDVKANEEMYSSWIEIAKLKKEEREMTSQISIIEQVTDMSESQQCELEALSELGPVCTEDITLIAEDLVSVEADLAAN